MSHKSLGNEIESRAGRNLYLTSALDVGTARAMRSYSLRAPPGDRRTLVPTHTLKIRSHMTRSGIRVARPCRPMSCPRLKAPYFPAASLARSIESRLAARFPAQNDGQDECTIGQESCMASCDEVETTMMVRNTLQQASVIRRRRHGRVARVKATASPRHNNGMHAPA